MSRLTAVIISIFISAGSVSAGEKHVSALWVLEQYAGKQATPELPAAVAAPVPKASPKKSSLDFEPVPDPEAPGGLSCRNAQGTEGLNDIDLQELASTKVGYCGNFKGVTLPDRFDLRGADLRGAQFVYANIIGARMSKADLTGAVFFAVDAYHVDMSDALMNGVWVENSTFGYGNLRRVQMTGGAFRGVMLYGVKLSFANLDGVDMRGCAMYGEGATLEGTSMKGADLRNAYFTNYEAYGGSDNTTIFDGTVLAGSIYNEKSRFPFDGDEALKRGMTLRPGEY